MDTNYEKFQQLTKEMDGLCKSQREGAWFIFQGFLESRMSDREIKSGDVCDALAAAIRYGKQTIE